MIVTTEMREAIHRAVRMCVSSVFVPLDGVTDTIIVELEALTMAHCTMCDASDGTHTDNCVIGYLNGIREYVDKVKEIQLAQVQEGIRRREVGESSGEAGEESGEGGGQGHVEGPGTGPFLSNAVSDAFVRNICWLCGHRRHVAPDGSARFCEAPGCGCCNIEPRPKLCAMCYHKKHAEVDRYLYRCETPGCDCPR